MGGSSSKPVVPVAPAAPDLSSMATVSLGDAQKVASQLQASATAAAAQAAQALQSESSAWGSFKIVGWLFLVVVVIFVGLVGYEFLAVKFGWPVIPGFIENIQQKISDLSVTRATHGETDVTPSVINMIQNGTLTIPSSLSSTIGSVSGKPLKAGDPFVITYQYSGDPEPLTHTVPDDQDVIISHTNKPGTTSSGERAPAPAQKSTPPGFFANLWSKLTGGSGSSGDLSGSKDAASGSTIPSSKAPLSADDRGAYGIQWWMYVKDWNYGFGKEKSVVKRTDASAASVINPHVSLHPTENTLKISVSVFSDSEGSTGKAEPAPAGHSGSGEDVYVCEVPNIPLQSWFSVGVTVFGRNLDVYIDGKLVKSCFLPGIPKPAAGDIQLTPGGGFSGNLCGFTHYSRMLTPGDAMNYWSAGSSCQSTPNPDSKATSGYAVKFGVFNPGGKQIQEYSF